MRIAILGGGFTGLAASYYLAKKGHETTIFEKEKVLGGLAVGFKSEGWNWHLERAYHHLLDSEDDILDFAREIGFSGLFFKNTQTASLYDVSGHPELVSVSDFTVIPDQVRDDPEKNGIDYRTFPLDSPQDLLRFPPLSLPEKIRAGFVLAFLKTSPFLTLYEKQTAQVFLKKSMGDRVWEVLWQELFRKKFGKYAENILASFIWARIKKRAKRLGYIKGGFQTLINYIENELKGLRVNVLTGYEIKKIEKKGNKFIITCHPEFISGSDSKKQMLNQIQHDKISTASFDTVISTLPTVIMSKVTQSIFPQTYLQKFSKLKYLHAVVLILETKQPILEKTYWLNICAPKIPIMIVAQHTNFIDKKNYGGNNIAYVGWYVNLEDRIWKMEGRELLRFVTPHLKKISNKQLTINNYYLFHGPFAQPIFDKDFVKNKPAFITPVKNFYIANLDMTYPYDRGTNYAVKLGKEVTKIIG